MPRIVPNLWFDDQALEAAEHYVSIFPSSRIVEVTHYNAAGPGEPGSVLTVDFELDGQLFTALNGGPVFTFSAATSLLIECQDQAEIDHYWSALIAGGGEEGHCGWLKDRYGFSWQVCPVGFNAVLNDPDQAKAVRVTEALYQMHKIDIATLEAAAEAMPA